MPQLTEKEKQLKMQEKYQAVLSQLLREEDNKYCADCDAKGPRWASWNLGIFLCIRCAGIHRNLGVHISRVKSVNLDQWTAEQIASMQAIGNNKARSVYEAELPESFRRSQTDSAMEQFIRAKYEQQKWKSKASKSSSSASTKTSASTNTRDEILVTDTKKTHGGDALTPSVKETSSKVQIKLNIPTQPGINIPFAETVASKTKTTNLVDLLDSDNIAPQQPISSNKDLLNEDLFLNFNLDNNEKSYADSFKQPQVGSSSSTFELKDLLLGPQNPSSQPNPIKQMDKNSIMALYNGQNAGAKTIAPSNSMNQLNSIISGQQSNSAFQLNNFSSVGNFSNQNGSKGPNAYPLNHGSLAGNNNSDLLLQNLQVSPFPGKIQINPSNPAQLSVFHPNSNVQNLNSSANHFQNTLSSDLWQ